MRPKLRVRARELIEMRCHEQIGHCMEKQNHLWMEVYNETDFELAILSDCFQRPWESVSSVFISEWVRHLNEKHPTSLWC